MKLQQRFRRPARIESEVYEKIRIGVPEGQKKKFVVQEIARDVFLAHFPRGGNLTNEGSRIARHIFYGGFVAAEELNWKVEKALKPLARGLLAGMSESGSDFFTGVWVVVHAAILCAQQTQADLHKATERVIGVVLKAGRERECNMDYLTNLVTRTAAEAVGSFPEGAIAPTEQMLLGLLAGQVHIDEEGCQWRSPQPSRRGGLQ